MTKNLLLLAVLAGCGRPVEPAPPSFTPDPVAGGAALFTRAEVSATDVKVEVVARQLGPVLGYAFTLRYSGLSPIDPDATRPLEDAVYLVKAGDGSLAVGAARKGPAAGEQTVDDETVLAAGRFRIDGPATLKLEGTSVRRANGDGVTVALGGGSIR